MGAAKYAKEKYGAIYGQGYGLQGQSFGIPTKSASLELLEPNVIRDYVNKGMQEKSKEFLNLNKYKTSKKITIAKDRI